MYGIESKIENIDNQQEKQELDNKIDHLKSYKLSLKNTSIETIQIIWMIMIYILYMKMH